MELTIRIQKKLYKEVLSLPFPFFCNCFLLQETFIFYVVWHTPNEAWYHCESPSKLFLSPAIDKSPILEPTSSSVGALTNNIVYEVTLGWTGKLLLLAEQANCYRNQKTGRKAADIREQKISNCWTSSAVWPRQNFCLPFLYSFNIVFLLIEKSRIPLIDNSRMRQHRERYNRNRSSKPSGFYLEKSVNSLPNGFVTDVRFILYFRWIHKKMFFFPPKYSV